MRCGGVSSGGTIGINEVAGSAGDVGSKDVGGSALGLCDRALTLPRAGVAGELVKETGGTCSWSDFGDDLSRRGAGESLTSAARFGSGFNSLSYPDGASGSSFQCALNNGADDGVAKDEEHTASTEGAPRTPNSCRDVVATTLDVSALKVVIAVAGFDTVGSTVLATDTTGFGIVDDEIAALRAGEICNGIAVLDDSGNVERSGSDA